MKLPFNDSYEMICSCGKSLGKVRVIFDKDDNVVGVKGFIAKIRVGGHIAKGHTLSHKDGRPPTLPKDEGDD